MTGTELLMFMMLIPFLILGVLVPGLWVLLDTLVDDFFEKKKKQHAN